MWALTLVITLAALGAAVPSAQQQRAAALVMTTAGWTFDITGWMAAALWDKAQTALTPGRALTPPRAGWCAYLDRAAAIREGGGRHRGALRRGRRRDRVAQRPLQARLGSLRAPEQDAVRSTVEQIIERQVGGELARRGLGFAGASFPPVQFTFVEPPKKLVVSPRDRIATVHYRMLQPAFSTADAEATEATIAANFDLSAYVTRIGGLGAYPSMVIDRGDIPWIMSTVAGGPNYLTLFHLGLRATISSPQLTTINETVAEIVGNEVGAAVVARYYPGIRPEAQEDATSAAGRRYAARGRPAAQRADAVRLPHRDAPHPSHGGSPCWPTVASRARSATWAAAQQFVANGYPIRKLSRPISPSTAATAPAPPAPIRSCRCSSQLATRGADTRAFLRTVQGHDVERAACRSAQKSDF
ncbi:MAG: hypothetical protein R2854_03325 [Caldilineaceae bacterium]